MMLQGGLLPSHCRELPYSVGAAIIWSVVTEQGAVLWLKAAMHVWPDYISMIC